MSTRVEGYHGSVRLMWVLRWQVMEDGHSLSDERYVMKRMLVQVRHLVYVTVSCMYHAYIMYIPVHSQKALMQVGRVCSVGVCQYGSEFH